MVQLFIWRQESPLRKHGAQLTNESGGRPGGAGLVDGSDDVRGGPLHSTATAATAEAPPASRHSSAFSIQEKLRRQPRWTEGPAASRCVPSWRSVTAVVYGWRLSQLGQVLAYRCTCLFTGSCPGLCPYDTRPQKPQAFGRARCWSAAAAAAPCLPSQPAANGPA